jgi:hypothetical protein
MQTAGTAFQLAGSIIALAGLVYAWHVTTGRITRWRDDLRNRLIEAKFACAPTRSAPEVRLATAPPNSRPRLTGELQK